MLYFVYGVQSLCIVMFFVIFYFVLDRVETNHIQVIDIIMIVCLVLFAGFRYNVGSDFSTYELMYNFYSKSIVDVPKERLFFHSMYYLKRIYDNPQIIFWFVALLVYPMLIIYMRKVSTKPSLLFAYYMLGGFWASSLNIMRQAIAMSILLWAYYVLKKKKLLTFVVLCIIASEFHVSSIFISVILVLAVLIKPNKNAINKVIGFSVLFAIFGRNVLNFLCKKIPVLTYYSHYMTVGDSSMDRLRKIGAFGFLAFSIFCAIITSLNGNELAKKTGDKKAINFCMLSVIISAFAINFPYINRVSLYLLLIPMESVPAIWKNKYKVNNKNVVHILLLIIMSMWCIFISVFGLDNLSWKYNFIWNK